MMSRIKLGIVFIISLLIFSSCSEGSEVTSEVNGTFDVNITNQDLLIEDLWSKCIHNSHGDECYVVRKFGESANIGNTPTPISNGEVYQTPTVLTTLEIVSTDSDDTISGLGARTIKVTGLSTNWEEITETVNLNGTTPVTLTNQFFRVYRMVVDTTGTYAGQAGGSHQGDISLTGTIGSELWARISINGVSLGQTEIGAYTIPFGYHGHLGNMFIHNNGNKIANIYMFQRKNASDVIVPYTARTILFQLHGLVSGESLSPKSISHGFIETTDIGFLANTDSGTTEVSVDFEILLIRGEH